MNWWLICNATISASFLSVSILYSTFSWLNYQTNYSFLFLFVLFYCHLGQEKKKNTGDSHLVYGRLSTLLIRMLFSKSTCQWHAIKTAFQMRIFRSMEASLTNGNIPMCTDSLSEGQEVSFGRESLTPCFFLKIFILDSENGACSWMLWKSSRNSQLLNT